MGDRKIYETQFALGAKVQSSMSKSFSVVNTNIKGVEKQASKSAQAVDKMAGTLKHMAEGAIAAFGIHEVMDFAKEAADAAKEEAGNETKLVTIMQQRVHATDSQIDSIHRLIEAQLQNGVVSQGTQLAGAQQLALYVKSSTSIKALLPVMNNLLAQQKGVNASEQDAVTDAKAFGRALNGQAAGLSRMGIVLSKSQQQFFKTATEQQKVAMLAQLIQAKVGNMNAAFAQTDAGKLKEQQNMLELIRVKIGEKIIPIQAKFAEMFLKAVPYIQKMLPILDDVPKALQVMLPIAQGVLGVITGIFGFIAKNWPAIRPIVIGVGSALLFVKTATLALVVAQKAGMIIGSLTTMYNTASAALALLREGNSLAAVAQLVLNGTMWLCPITWIVAGLMALVAVIILVVKNWKTMVGWFSKTPKPKLQKVTPQMTTDANMWNSPGLGGKPIPQHANGTNYFKGGLTWAGEKGPELINAPRGSKILNNQRTNRLLNNLSGGNNAPNIISVDYHPQVTIQGNANEKVLNKAYDDAYQEFKRNFKALMADKKRLEFSK